MPRLCHRRRCTTCAETRHKSKKQGCRRAHCDTCPSCAGTWFSTGRSRLAVGQDSAVNEWIITSSLGHDSHGNGHAQDTRDTALSPQEFFFVSMRVRCVAFRFMNAPPSGLHSAKCVRSILPHTVHDRATRVKCHRS